VLVAVAERRHKRASKHFAAKYVTEADRVAKKNDFRVVGFERFHRLLLHIPDYGVGAERCGDECYLNRAKSKSKTGKSIHPCHVELGRDGLVGDCEENEA